LEGWDVGDEECCYGRQAGDVPLGGGGGCAVVVEGAVAERDLVKISEVRMVQHVEVLDAAPWQIEFNLVKDCAEMGFEEFESVLGKCLGVCVALLVFEDVLGVAKGEFVGLSVELTVGCQGFEVVFAGAGAGVGERELIDDVSQFAR